MALRGQGEVAAADRGHNKCHPNNYEMQNIQIRGGVFLSEIATEND
jgi:hypothetical protein